MDQRWFAVGRSSREEASEASSEIARTRGISGFHNHNQTLVVLAVAS
jgi:hypothetical protein